MNDINDPYVMDYGTFLNKYAPINPNIDTEMKTIKKWIEISASQREILIERLSLLLIWLFKEKKIKGTEMAMRLGFPGSDLSMIKNRNAKLVSDWKIILIAVSFGIKIEDFDNYFDCDKYLGEIKTNKWDSPFFDHPLGSNLYHEEIAYFNSWYGKHEREVTEQFKKDQVDALLAETRVHEAMEEKILAGEIVEMLGSGSVSEKTLFENEIIKPAPIIQKSLSDIIRKENKPELKESPLFDTSKHMPKETGDVMALNQINVMNSSKARKLQIESEIMFHQNKIAEHKLSIARYDAELNLINDLLKLYGQ